MRIEEPASLNEAVVDAFNRGDLAAVLALYEHDARMVGMDGVLLADGPALRGNWAALLAFGGRMTLSSRYVIEADGIALLSNDYTVTVGDDEVRGVTAEVARRQPDGTWRYLIDHPTAG